MARREKIIALRLSPEEEDVLRRLVRHANALADEHGLPGGISASAYIRNLIAKASENLRNEEEPTRQVRLAPNVALARKKLREGRS